MQCLPMQLHGQKRWKTFKNDEKSTFFLIPKKMLISNLDPINWTNLGSTGFLNFGQTNLGPTCVHLIFNAPNVANLGI